MTAAAKAACGVTLPNAATPQANRYDAWARAVADILTAALARDDERNRIRCPRCHRPYHEDQT